MAIFPSSVAVMRMANCGPSRGSSWGPTTHSLVEPDAVRDPNFGRPSECEKPWLPGRRSTSCAAPWYAPPSVSRRMLCAAISAIASPSPTSSSSNCRRLENNVRHRIRAELHSTSAPIAAPASQATRPISQQRCGRRLGLAESDSPRIRNIASAVGRSGGTDAHRMELLAARVRALLTGVDFVGHYSALEALARRAGVAGIPPFFSPRWAAPREFPQKSSTGSFTHGKPIMASATSSCRTAGSLRSRTAAGAATTRPSKPSTQLTLRSRSAMGIRAQSPRQANSPACSSGAR